MIILGTPQISFNFGIPEWAVWLIVFALYFGYRGVKRLIKRRDAKLEEEQEFLEEAEDINLDDNP